MPPLGAIRSRSLASRVLAGALALAASAAASVAAFAGDDPAEAPAPAVRYHRIRVIDFDGEIEPAIEAYAKRRLAEAKAWDADCIVLRINSPGGEVFASEAIADAVLALPKSIHTIAWVPHWAMSGASMVSLACDEIVMAPGASIGDCQPILGGVGAIVPAGEKIETYLRAKFRRYAEDNGWPRLLAEKMVSVDIEVVRLRTEDGRTLYADGTEFDSARDDDLVEGVAKRRLTRVGIVVGKGRLLTLTTEEALKLGFVHRTFEKESQFLDALAAPGAVIEKDEMSVSESASRTLLGFVGILAAIVLVCAGFTIWHGVGTLSFIGLGAILLVVLITSTAGLANGFPLVLIGVGLALLAAEAFLIPGFGIAGVLGIVSTVLGFLFLSTGFSPGHPGTLGWASTGSFLLQFILTILGSILAVILAVRFFPGLPLVSRYTRMRNEGLTAGSVALPSSAPGPAPGDFHDADGTALTDLRPAGRATLRGADRLGVRGRASAEGIAIDVTSEGGFVERGTPVHVVRIEGNRVFVRPTSDGKPAAGRPA